VAVLAVQTVGMARTRKAAGTDLKRVIRAVPFDDALSLPPGDVWGKYRWAGLYAPDWEVRGFRVGFPLGILWDGPSGFGIMEMLWCVDAICHGGCGDRGFAS
jgi:hypothetical protein